MTANTAQPSGLPCPDSSSSFWHSEPNAFLLNHRTTPDLPAKADIVIIGSGITGASIARYLAESPQSADLSIVMLEAREICWGATGRNGGHCQPLLFDRPPDVAAFEVKNVEAVKSYIEANDVACEWRSVTGCRSFWNQGLFDECQAEIEKLRKADPVLGRRVQVVQGSDKETLRAHRVSTNAVGVTLTEGAGQLWPYKLITFIIEKLVKQGKLNVQTNTPVVKIEDKSNSDHHRILHTPRGTISARHTILATNGYTSHLLPDTFSELIVPVRHEMTALHPPLKSTPLPDSHGMVGYAAGNPDHDDYLIQRPFYVDASGHRRGGHLMFGGGRGKATHGSIHLSDDDIIDPGTAHYLHTQLPKMLDLGPGGDVSRNSPLTISHVWTGITGYSKDNTPWVGRVPATPRGTAWYSDLWLCAGYTGHGMPNATLCARALAAMVLAEIAGLVPHAEICAQLVKRGELPEAYLITERRLAAVSRLPGVAEREAQIQIQIDTDTGTDREREREMPSAAENAMPVQTGFKCEVM